MTSIQILDEVLASLTPLFATHGYKKAARYFIAKSGGVARVIQFETSQLKKPEQAKFTVNVMVASHAFHEAYAGSPFPKNAGSAEPVVQASFGKLMPDGEPIWWSLEPRVSSALVAKEVEGLLREVVFPFLDRFRDEATLLAELEGGQKLPGFSAMRERCKAVLMAKNGRKAEAKKVLAALVEANSGADLQGFRDSVNTLAQRLGV